MKTWILWQSEWAKDYIFHDPEILKYHICPASLSRLEKRFYKHLKAVMADLKAIYQAPTEDDALYHLEEFKEKWDKNYPQIAKSWEANWAALSAHFKYPAEVRRLIYITNAVEGFHRMLRKYTKTKTVFPSDDSLKKSIYLSIQEITKKWSMPVPNWGIIMGQLSIFFEEWLSNFRVA